MNSAATPRKPRLILVYNADSGLFTALIHTIHKQLRPSTYPCSLCAITYGVVSMHGKWRRFLDRLDCEVVIHHRDEFARAFPELGMRGAREIALPAILFADPGEEPRMLIPADELDGMENVHELMEALTARLPSHILMGTAGKLRLDFPA